MSTPTVHRSRELERRKRSEARKQARKSKQVERRSFGGRK